MGIECDTAKFVEQRVSDLPGFRVFEKSRRALVQHARDHDMLNLKLDHAGAAVLAETLQQPADEGTLFARLFLDLWYCANFSDELWAALRNVDLSFAELAVEACYYVFWTSGANGAPDLRRLLAQHGALSAVHASNIARCGDAARHWAHTVEQGSAV